MNSTDTLHKNIIKYAIFSAIFATIIIFLFFRDNASGLLLGLLLGLSVSTLNFVELYNTIKRSVSMNPAKAQAYTVKKYFIRYILSGAAILVAVKAPYLDIVGTVIGMLLIKGVIFITNLFSDKQFYSNIFKRREV